MSSWLTAFGLMAALWIVSSALMLGRAGSMLGDARVQPTARGGKTTLRLLAVGDVNLGRIVGQEVLKGDTLFPFARVQREFITYDLVFANLESQLSNQSGETQHPRNNLIFTGPPAGAFSLRRGGVTVVSTANNHALDYGLRGLRETMENLKKAGVPFSGTALHDSLLFEPVVLSRQGISVAIFSCTDVMNMEDRSWERYVAPADSARLFPRIREYRTRVDLILLSYHGGEEYASQPTERTRAFARASLHEGVDLFLGHHPHVPQGVEESNGRFIVYSLGNFVFRQPFSYWTQRSFAFAVTVTKQMGIVRLSDARIIPVSAGLQPGFLEENAEKMTVLARIASLSRKNGEEAPWIR